MHKIKEFNFRHISALDSLMERCLEESIDLLPEDTREFVINVDDKTFNNLQKEFEEQAVYMISKEAKKIENNTIAGIGMHGIRFTIVNKDTKIEA